jgi:hypothetical protein
MQDNHDFMQTLQSSMLNLNQNFFHFLKMDLKNEAEIINQILIERYLDP